MAAVLDSGIANPRQCYRESATKSRPQMHGINAGDGE